MSPSVSLSLLLLPFLGPSLAEETEEKSWSNIKDLYR